MLNEWALQAHSVARGNSGEEHMKNRQRLLAFILSVMMIITYMPAIAFAEGDKAATDIPAYTGLTAEAEVVEPDTDLAGSDALLWDYLSREVGEKTAASNDNGLTLLRGAKTTRGSRLKGIDLLLYSHLKGQIEYVIDPVEGDSCNSTEFLLPLEELLGRDSAYPVEEIPVEDPENAGKIIMIETSKVPAEDFEEFIRREEQ